MEEEGCRRKVIREIVEIKESVGEGEGEEEGEGQTRTGIGTGAVRQGGRERENV